MYHCAWQTESLSDFDSVFHSYHLVLFTLLSFVAPWQNAHHESTQRSNCLVGFELRVMHGSCDAPSHAKSSHMPIAKQQCWSACDRKSNILKTSGDNSNVDRISFASCSQDVTRRSKSVTSYMMPVVIGISGKSTTTSFSTVGDQFVLLETKARSSLLCRFKQQSWCSSSR